MSESGGLDGDAGGTGVGLGFDEKRHVMPIRTEKAREALGRDIFSLEMELVLDVNFYVLPECYKKVHQAFYRKALQLVMEESGNLWLVDAECGRDLNLGEPLPFDDPVESGAKLGFSVEFRRIGQT